MSAVQVAEYLAGHTRIIVVTNGPGGMPHPVPMNYGIDDAGRVVITSFAASQKVRNLERDPKASLLVESGATYHELNAVILYCDAELVRDPDEIAHGMRVIRADVGLAESLTSAMSAQVRASLAKRVLVRFTAFRTVSWDHARLGEAY